MDTNGIFDMVFSIESLIAAVVFVLVVGAVGVAIWLAHRRRKQGRPPSGRSENNRVEKIYGGVILGVAIGVIWLSIHTNDEEAPQIAHPAAKVAVTGFQWCWQFGYPGHDVTVRGTCKGGDTPTMVVPTGVPVQITTTSTDVIHSWWVPHLKYKMDAFPDHTNRFTIMFAHPGRWLGHCAEFCGQYHYGMTFYVKAVPMSQYRQWLASSGGSAA